MTPYEQLIEAAEMEMASAREQRDQFSPMQNGWEYANHDLLLMRSLRALLDLPGAEETVAKVYADDE